MPPTRPWSGRLFFGPGRLLYAGPLGETTPHVHLTFQLVLALEGRVSLRDDRQRVVACQAAVIPSRARHAVMGTCPSALLLHVAAEEETGRRLRQVPIALDDARSWEQAGARLLTCRPERLPRTWAQAESVAQQLLGRLQESERPTPRHPAVVHLLRHLPEALGQDVRLTTLAHQVGLSAGRLSHLFRAEVGTPLRPYLLWLRMQRAAEQMSAGVSLTRAAHVAGFSDGAHLSHVFRRMFGLPPSAIAGAVEWRRPGQDG